jgi:hypothetical protein
MPVLNDFLQGNCNNWTWACKVSLFYLCRFEETARLATKNRLNFHVFVRSVLKGFSPPFKSEGQNDDLHKKMNG